MLNEKEIKFLQFVNNSNNAYVKKFDILLRTSVLSQLSRHMLTELFENYRDNIDNKMNVKAICMQCPNSLFNIVKNIAKKYFELAKQFEIDVEMEQQAMYEEEDRIEEERLSTLLNNDENRIALYKSRDIFNAEYVENTIEMDSEKLIEIFDKINENDLELSVEKINEIYIENKLKNHILDVINKTKNDENITSFETIIDNNTLGISTYSNTLEVFTEEKKDEFVKPKIIKKTDNTTPLLNKNKKKTNKR